MSNKTIAVHTDSSGKRIGTVTGTVEGGKIAMDVNVAGNSGNPPTSFDASNSTALPLTNGSVFLGPWTQRTTPEILMAPSSDQNFTYYAQFATTQLSDSLPYTAGTADGVDSSVPYTFDASDFKSRIPRLLKIAREWYRIAIVNTSGTDMTYLRFQTSLGQYGPLASKLNAALLPDADAAVVRAIIAGQQPDGDYVNTPADGLATDVNAVGVETAIPLSGGASYVSGWCDTDGFKSIEISIKTDQLSAVDGIIIEYTNDANTGTPAVEQTKTFTYNADSVALGDLTILIPPRLDGFRVTYTNGATPQGSFLLVATLRTAPVQSVELPISSPINKNTNANITRTVSVGETPDGEFKNAVQSGLFTQGSTSTPLGIGGEFIGEFLDASRYVMLQIAIISDQYYDDTAYTDTQGNTGGVLLELSADGVTVAQSFALRISDTDVPPNYFLYFTPGRQFVRFKYTNGDTAQGLFELSLFSYTNAIGAPVGSVRSGLSNFSLATQTKSAVFGIDELTDPLNPTFNVLPLTSAGTEINNSAMTVVTKNVQVAEDEAGDYGRIERVANAVKVYIDDIKTTIDSSVRPNTGLDVFQLAVDDTNAVQVVRPNATRVAVPRQLKIINADASVSVYYGYDDTVSTTTGFPVLPQTEEIINIGDDTLGGKTASEVWVIAGPLTATTATDTLDADTVDSSTATSAGEQFASDDSRAIYDASGETSTISGFDATGAGVQTNVTSIKIKAEMRKEPSAGNEVSALVDVVGADAGNVASITSPTVTANADHFYVVAISSRDEFSNITQINNTMGFTSFTLIDDTLQASAESRTSVYYAVGTPTSNGTITASFSQAADHCVISVTRFSDINKTNPVGATTIFGANNSLGAYSGSVDSGAQGGQFYLALGFEQGTHAAAATPAGAAERFEDGSTAGNDQSQAVVTAAVASAGAVSFSGSTTGTADITYVAVTLNPSPAKDPTITISHSEGATTLAQSLTSETDAVYEVDITADSATWSVAQIDAMTVTATASGVGVASAEIDRIYLDITSSSTVVSVPISWLGDKP